MAEVNYLQFTYIILKAFPEQTIQPKQHLSYLQHMLLSNIFLFNDVSLTIIKVPRDQSSCLTWAGRKVNEPKLPFPWVAVLTCTQ